MSEQKRQIDNPPLFLAVSFFFIISLFIVIRGLSKLVSSKSEPEAEIPQIQQLNLEENVSISEFFNNDLTDETESGTDSYYLQTDPFRSICESSGAGNNPAVTFGTVCFR